ncbi:Protein CFT1 [Leucoagaricus sp. SymC.cos]|nr:Protein CFT1 [Leucoagaricus sp. SymC.cos]
MDGFEFATNEYVNDMTIVTLETAATETGTKDFIAVGTTIDRGEDLAVKGATYIFEIAEVVPDPAVSQRRWYRLRLRCRDDAKGPVTAVCGLNDYLVSSMGQKIFVRAFDSDERLVGVAFMDVGVYVTSLRTLKNLLLIGDAVKSISFVAFQEDPYKLVLLSKDTHRVCVTNAEFLFTESELRIVTGDEEGIVRVYEYNPQDPDSQDGRHLLLRTEFHGQREYRTSVVVAHRTKGDPPIPNSRLLTGSTNGSLASLTILDESAFKRLGLLQGQLIRNIQHTAALNPKAFRIVRNDYVLKPLTRGILDGNLLGEYEGLPINRQMEVTQQIGTDRVNVLRDWIEVRGAW